MSRSYTLPLSMALVVTALLGGTAPAIADDEAEVPPGVTATVAGETGQQMPTPEEPAQEDLAENDPSQEEPVPPVEEQAVLAEAQADRAEPLGFAAEDTSVPEPPTFTAIGARDTVAYFNWTYAAGDPATSGSVLVTVWNAETGGEPVKTCSAPAPGTYCEVYGLKLYQKYWVSVQRVQLDGAISEHSKREMIEPRKAPDGPTGLAAEIVEGHIEVSWTKSPDPIDAPVIRYDVWVGGTAPDTFAAGFPVSGAHSSASIDLESVHLRHVRGHIPYVRVTATNLVGDSDWLSSPRVVLTQRVPVSAVTPALGAPTSIANGFTVKLSNFDPDAKYEVTTTFGTAKLVGDTITVSGLAGGSTADIFVKASKAGYFSGSATTRGTAGLPNATLRIDQPVRTADGFTVKILDFDPLFAYDLLLRPETTDELTAKVVRQGDTIIVSGLSAGAIAYVGVDVSRSGWKSHSMWIVEYALLAPSSVPALVGDQVYPDGFSAVIANYNALQTYRIVAPVGVSATRAGDRILVTGLGANQEATIQVFSQWPGQREAESSFTGRSAKKPSVEFSVTGVTPTANGWTARIADYASLAGNDTTFTAVTTAGTVSVVEGVVAVTGLAPDEAADVTVTLNRTDTEPSTARAGGRALQEHTVTFDAGPGTPAVSAAAVTHGSPAEPPSPPVRERYVFTGWFADTEFTMPYDFDAPVTSNLTLHAGWEISTYAVTWNPNRGGAGVPDTVLIEGATLGALPMPVADGAVIREWNTRADGTGLAVRADTVLSEVATETEVALYAIWDVRTLSLTFDPGSSVSSTATAGDTVSLTATANAAFGGTVDVSDEVKISSTVPSDVAAQSRVRVTTAGPRTLTGVFDGATAVATLDVIAGPLGTLTLTPAQGTTDQGGSLDFTVTGADAEGNPVPIAAADVMLSSSVDGDDVDGLRVSFPTAGPRQITAWVAGAGASPTTADVTVAPRYLVSWDENWKDAAAPESEVVAADRLADLPDPSAAGWVISGWNTSADGSGAFVTTSTPLASVASGPNVTLYAIWERRTLTITPSSSAHVSGSTVDITATANAAFGGTVDVTADVELESSEPTDVVAGSTVAVTVAGPRTFTGEFDGARASAQVDVVAGAVAALTVTPSATTVDRGGRLEFSVAGVDAANNPVEIDPADVTITSDVATDVVDGLTVTFPTASPHVITARVGDVTASVTIEVRGEKMSPEAPGSETPQPGTAEATAARLTETGGGSLAPLAALAPVLLFAGVALVLRRRARNGGN